MNILLVFIVGIVSLFAGKYLFRFWFNPISIYVVIWGTELILYELRLIRYFDLSIYTWIIILSAFVCFLAGLLTIYLGRRLNPSSVAATGRSLNESSFAFDKNRFLHVLIYGFALIGIVGAIQHWSVLFNMFGTLPNIILNAPTIYMMRVQGKIQGVVPYLCTFLYVSVFLSGVYTGKSGKWHPGTLLAFGGVILEELANVARAGMLFVFLEFFTVVLLCRIGQSKGSKVRAANKKLVLAVSALFILLTFFATMIKSARTVMERFKSASRSLSRLNENLVVSPTIYLYFSSPVGVLNKYLEKERENTMWGENTFLPIYNFVSKTGVIKHPSFYQKGYFVPMWTNTGTYLREVHSDFGYVGIFLVPYLLGLGIAFFWYRYFHFRQMYDLVFLVYFLLILYFSFSVMITRLGIWWISMVILLYVIHIIERKTMTRGISFDRSCP